MTSLVREFKKFALKGNVVDLAVGVIIGAAFGRIVSSLVDHIIMPPMGLLVGGVDFSQLRYVLREPREGVTEVAIGYGMFLQNLFTFVIISWALFLLVRTMNRLNTQRKPAASTPEDILILREIRDSLKQPRA